MNEKNFQVKVELDVNLTQENIDDIMVSALEGGINYWCSEAEVVEDKRCADWGHEQIARGGALILHDAESGGKWELNLEKFLNGFKLWVEQGYAHDGVIAQGSVDGNMVAQGIIDTSMIDAEDADVIVQFALFKKLVFC